MAVGCSFIMNQLLISDCLVLDTQLFERTCNRRRSVVSTRTTVTCAPRSSRCSLWLKRTGVSTQQQSSNAALSAGVRKRSKPRCQLECKSSGQSGLVKVPLRRIPNAVETVAVETASTSVETAGRSRCRTPRRRSAKGLTQLAGLWKTRPTRMRKW